jgi:hypothetical protein
VYHGAYIRFVNAHPVSAGSDQCPAITRKEPFFHISFFRAFKSGMVKTDVSGLEAVSQVTRKIFRAVS